MLRAVLLTMMLVLAGVPTYGADKFQGYRIGGGNSKLDLLGGALQFGIPIPVAIDTEELVVDLPFRVRPVGVSGRVEHLSFSQLAVNGIPFSVDPYSELSTFPTMMS